MSADESIHRYIEDHTDLLVDRLTEWVRIPSVADVPERQQHLVRSANWLAGELRGIGFPVTEIWEAPGGPAVFAE